MRGLPLTHGMRNQAAVLPVPVLDKPTKLLPRRIVSNAFLEQDLKAFCTLPTSPQDLCLTSHILTLQNVSFWQLRHVWMSKSLLIPMPVKFLAWHSAQRFTKQSWKLRETQNTWWSKMRLQHQASICFTTSGIGSLGPSPCKHHPVLIQMHPAHQNSAWCWSTFRAKEENRQELRLPSRCFGLCKYLTDFYCHVSHDAPRLTLCHVFILTQQPAEPLAKSAHGTPSHSWVRLELSINAKKHV